MNEDSNADALVSFFDGLSREIKKDIVKRGVTRATVAVHNRAMENVNGPRSAPARSYPVPVRTAELRNGIKAKLPGQAKGLPNMPDGVPPELAGAVVSEAPHSVLIHDGHAEPIEIRPVKAKALKFKVIEGVQTHYKRGPKAGQELDSPVLKFKGLFRMKAVLPPAGPRPFLEDARNGSADEALGFMAEEVAARIEEANGKGG